MKKTARRTLSLALSLVLICALAAVAFAVPSVEVQEEFFGYNMFAVAEVDQYYTDIDLYAEPANAAYTISGEVTLRCSFEWMDPIEDRPYGVYNDTLAVNVTDGDYYYRKTFYPSQHNILKMRYASYAVDVDITSSRGIVNFAPNTIYVTYPD